MNKRLQHIEDFVRSKLGMLEGDSQPDWLNFERKLRRAARIRQMKRVAGVVGVVLLLGFSQVFISGDWPLKERVSESALRVLEKSEKNQEKQNELPKAQTADSPRELKVLHRPEASRQLVSQEQNTNSVESSSSWDPGNNSNHVLALANTKAKPGTNKQTEAPVLEREIVAIDNFEHQVVLEPMANGKLMKDGKEVGDMPLPYDYQVPSSTLTYENVDPELPEYLQDNGSNEPYISPLQEKRPWTYSLNLYPNFAFREFKIDPTKRALLHSDFIDAMQHSESSGVNVNVGFEISRRVGPITYFNFGLEYINNSYNAEYDFVNFRDANFDSRGEIINYTLLDDPQRIVFSDLNSFHFLNFPASISYQPWATDNLRINLEFGFSMLYFLKAQGSTIDYRTLEQIDLSDRSYRSYIASSSLKIGLQYYLNPNMNIGFEPTLMYFTNSIYTEDYPFEVIPYSMGLNVNLQMKLQ